MSKFYERKQGEDLEVLQDLLKNVRKVKYYGYRESFVENIIYCFEKYEKNEELKKIEKKLFEEVGKKRQNHEVFRLELKGGGEFFIMLNDSYLVVGLTLNKKRW